jgi:hypothetical protein
MARRTEAVSRYCFGIQRMWRSTTVALMFALVSCNVVSEEDSAQSAVVLPPLLVHNAPVALKASREYKHGTSWVDGEVSFQDPIEFIVPARIPVREGNAGNHRAELWFRDPTGVMVNCDFRGGSDDPHPTEEHQRALGREYIFDRCSNGATAGDIAHAKWFKLHVRVGDQKDPAGRTEIELKLGGTPELPPPLSTPESIKLRDSFTWEKTQPLAERTSENLPTLYYALIYIEDREQLAALDEMQIHHDGLPLFGEEFARWDGQQGFFLHESDGAGIFRFAIIPGIIYNQIRQAALEGHVIFRVISLRSIPESARDMDGSISYAALRASAFRYRDSDPSIASGKSNGIGQVRQALFGPIVRRVVKVIAEVAEGVVEEVRHGIGVVDRYVNGSVTLTIDLHFLNTDLSFDRTSAMMRAWGKEAGNELRVSGIRVSARQRHLLGAGPLSTLFHSETGDDGMARLKVAKDPATSFCVAVESAAAEVTNFLTEIEYCNFGGTVADADKDWPLYFQHQYGSILAQVSDARQYMRDVVGFTPHKATILVGPLTWLWGKLSLGTDAMVPCFGLPNLLVGSVFDAVAAEMCLDFAALLGPRAGAECFALTSTLYGIDIIVPEVSNSRSLMTHEYGHFALCSMLYDENPLTYTLAYSGAMLSRMDPNSDPDDVAGYVNEGFADFISSQVAGATNYFASLEDYPSLDMSYCGAKSPSVPMVGLEVNRRHSSSSFDENVAWVTSTLHDAFDGWLSGENTPGNGNLWENKPPLVLKPRSLRDLTGEDEAVKLYGSQIRQLVHEIDRNGTWLNDENVMTGIATMAEQVGRSWCDRCLLFALHAPHFVPPLTPDKEASFCLQAPIRNWIGPKPGADFGCGQGGRIIGKALLNNTPTAGVLVKLVYQGGEIARVLTNADGEFQFAPKMPRSNPFDINASIEIDGLTYRTSASLSVADGRVSAIELALVAEGQRVVVSGLVTIVNAEIFKDIKTVLPLNDQVVLTPANPTATMFHEFCDTGNEVRVEVKLDFSLEGATVRLDGQYNMYEGTKCWHTELEDRDERLIWISPGESVQSHVRLEHRSAIGMDTADISLSIENKPLG